MFVVLTGGARSGKSAAAAGAAVVVGSPVCVVATGEALDSEMSERIARHRADRPAEWQVIEEPRDLAAAVALAAPDHTLIVDCVALWLSNRIDDSEADILGSLDAVIDGIRSRAGHTMVVTNEVGSAIVPDNALARRYRDLLGTVNQKLVGAADRAYLCVAGRLVPLVDNEVFGV